VFALKMMICITNTMVLARAMIASADDMIFFGAERIISILKPPVFVRSIILFVASIMVFVPEMNISVEEMIICAAKTLVANDR
jgi:hypothetical protein